MARSDKRDEMHFLDREWPAFRHHEEHSSDPRWEAAFDESRRFELANSLAEEFRIEDRASVLGLVTYMLNIWFGGIVVGSRPYEPDTLHDIAEASERLWNLATNDLNRTHMRWMFGSDHVRGMLRRLYKELIELRTFAKEAHVKPRRGQGKRKRQDLYYMIRQTAEQWVLVTGRKATNDWHDGQPVSEFARFCAAVVEYVDPLAVPKLRTVIRRVIERRNKEHQELDAYLDELADNTGEKD